jgi:hypothetical protein
MFRSLFQDYLQGSSFALSAPTTLQLHASSFVCIGMWSYALCMCIQCTCLRAVWPCFAAMQHCTQYHLCTGVSWENAF